MKKGLLGVSLFTLTCLYCVLFAVVFLIGLFVGAEMSKLILIAIIILVVQYLIAPFFTDLSMKWFYKARFDCQPPEYLVNFINSVCAQNNMKYPKIGYIDDGAPNAFTYGRTKNDARIVLTRGIFDLLTPEEVKAVVAHEIGHAVHYDMAVMTMAQLIPLVLYYCYEIFTKNVDDKDDAKLAIIGYIAYILYLISDYIILWLSRQREYYADSFSIEATRNPSALAEALVKIGFGLSTNAPASGGKSVSKGNALGIFDTNASKSLSVVSYGNGGISKNNIMHAMKWEMWNVWAKWYELHSTHPMVSKRLKAISLRCPEFNQPPYIDFNFQQPESYVDDFFGELFILSLPTIVIIGGLVLMLFMFIVNGDVNAEAFCFGIMAALFAAGLVKLSFTHKSNQFNPTTVFNLLSEVKVSGVTSVPCVLEGEIIGRGDPGCIFNEDFVIKDQTGIMFLDFKHVFRIADKFMALFKNKAFFNKRVRVTGWYRRSPVPYVEIYKIYIEGEAKERHMKSFGLKRFVYIAGIAICAVLMFMSF